MSNLVLLSLCLFLVIKLSTTSKVTTTTESPFGKKFLTISVDDTLWSYDGAKNECIKQNATLVELKSHEEQDFVDKVSVGSGDKVWLGIETNKSGVYPNIWLSGQRMDYADWDRRSPDTTKSCYAGILVKGWWHLEPCDQPLARIVVCQSPMTMAEQIAYRMTSLMVDSEKNKVILRELKRKLVELQTELKSERALNREARVLHSELSEISTKLDQCHSDMNELHKMAG